MVVSVVRHSYTTLVSQSRNMAPKTVAIVGAGPGGLVTAKTLLRSAPKDTFHVTIFEKSDRIGGIWSVTKDRADGIIPLDMPTNLSQFAVAFSDLAWSSVPMPGKQQVSMHPMAWQVSQYLEEYARRYIPKDCLMLQTEVRNIQEKPQGGWTIRYSQRGLQDEQMQHFDYCVLASGFYSKALPVPCNLAGFTERDCPVKMIHSSLYRGLDDVLPKEPMQGKKIMVIGGANSGGEAAAALAFDLSSARQSPSPRDVDYQIVHVLPKPVYGIPLFVPAADTPGTFVPLDVRLYDLGKRPDKPLNLKFAPHTDESKKMLHGMVQNVLGSDRYELGLQKPLAEQKGDLQVPKVAIQDNWASYVRSGAIKLQIGRVANLHGYGPDATISATVESTQDTVESTTINDIAGIIYATGYTPETALQILPQEVKKALSYDPTYPRLPILLPEGTLSSNPDVPDLAFVGLYEGPYWGVLEMQARQLAARWLKSLPTEQSETTRMRLSSLKTMRLALQETPHLVPQYIFSDYAAIMEESARELSLIGNNSIWSPDEGPIVPARYLDPGSNKSEADITMANLASVIEASAEKGRFVPRTVFRGLQGRWKIHRNLTSARPDFPSGVFEGEAWYHPRRPTTESDEHAVTSLTAMNTTDAIQPDKACGQVKQEYLYSESGTLSTTSGLKSPAYKSYVWRFSEDPNEEVSVWFVKTDAPREVDYLYHLLEFGSVPLGKSSRDAGQGDVAADGKGEDGSGQDTRSGVVWRAKADHLCERDMYNTEYEFEFDGVALKQFVARHEVKGPSKDYVSRTAYTR